MREGDSIHLCFLTKIYRVFLSDIFLLRRGLVPWRPWLGMDYHPRKSRWGEGVARIGGMDEDTAVRVSLLVERAFGANTRTLFGCKGCRI